MKLEQEISLFRRNLFSRGKAQSTIDAYCLELKKCLAGWCYSDDGAGVSKSAGLRSNAKLFISLAGTYIRKNGISTATSIRRYQALLAFAVQIGIKRSDFERLKPEAENRKGIDARVLQRDKPEEIFGGSVNIKIPSSRPERMHEIVWRRDRACTLLAAEMGLKAGEILMLRLCDLGVSRGRAWICAGRGNRRRRLPLPSATRRAILDYLLLRETEDGPESPVFKARNGQPLSLRTLQSGIKRVMKAAGADSNQGSARFLRAKLSRRTGNRVFF